MAAPLAMLPAEAEKLKEVAGDEAVSESSSTVVIGAKDKSDAEDEERKQATSSDGAKLSLSNPGGENKPGSGNQDEKEGDEEQKDGKGNKKGAISLSNDMAGPEPAPSPTNAVDEVAHKGFSCDECNVSPIVGPRYHCLDAACNNYNICSKCITAGNHNANDQMLCIRNPADAEKLKDEVAEGQDNSITLGLRVYTKGKSVATFSGQLRHGKVVGRKKKDKGSTTPQISSK